MQNPVPVQLPTGVRTSGDFAKSQERLVNLVNIGNNELVPRPGILPYSTAFGPCRGAVFYRKRLFQVSGERLTIIQDDPAAPPADVGEVQGSDLVFFAPGHTMMMILARGGKLLKWEDTGGIGTLTDVSDTPNFETSVDIAFMDGRWIYIPASGGPAFYSEVGDGADILPTNFFDAELLPDDNLGIINSRNTLRILGEQSIESFRSTGDEDAPFARVQGGQLQNGYISARIEYGSSYAFIGRNLKGSASIFVAGQGIAEPISNNAIDDILNDYSRDELYLARSQRYTWRRLDTLVFTLPRVSIAFAGGEWHIITSATDTDIEKPWTAVDSVYAYGRYLAGDINTARVGELTKVSSEYDLPVTYGFRTYVRNTPNSQMVVRAAELDTRMGFVPTFQPPTYDSRMEAHVASQWQIALDVDFTNIVYDSGDDSGDLEKLQVTTELAAGTQHFWRVRYKGEVTGYSEWSMPTNFTTLNNTVNTPYGIVPAGGSVDVLPDVTLEASAFLAVGTAQTHDASQWQVATDVNFTNIVFDSGIDAVNLESIPVTPDLDFGTIYYWRVAYEGSLTGFTPFSVPLQFTTISAGVQAPENQVPGADAVDVTVKSTAFQASEFVDINNQENHAASQWQAALDVDFVNIVMDSGTDTENLTTYTSTVLFDFDQNYYWRVRYQGNLTGFGPYSVPTRFTTEDIPDYSRVVKNGDARITADEDVRVVKEPES